MHSALVSWSWTLLCLSSESQLNLWTCVEALLALLWGSSSGGALSWYHIWQGNNVKPSPSSSTIAYFTSNIRNKLKMMIKWCESKHKLLPDPLDHNIGVSNLWPLAEIAKLLERSVTCREAFSKHFFLKWACPKQFWGKRKDEVQRLLKFNGNVS